MKLFWNLWYKDFKSREYFFWRYFLNIFVGECGFLNIKRKGEKLVDF